MSLSLGALLNYHNVKSGERKSREGKVNENKGNGDNDAHLLFVKSADS